MATATFDTITHDVEKLTPEEQARLMEYLEDLADVRAYDAAKAKPSDTLTWAEAMAEIERERAELGVE